MKEPATHTSRSAANSAEPSPAKPGPVKLGPVNLGPVRFWAGISIGWERLWPLVMPLVMTVALFLIISWFGIWSVVPEWVRLLLLGLFALGAAASLWPLRHFRLPSRQSIDFRVERRSALAHRPVTVQSDRLAAGDASAFSIALWREHQKRMGGKLKNLKSGVPVPAMSRRDPLGLRAVVVLLLFVAFGYASGEQGARVENAFIRHDASATSLTRLDVWVSPPPYTNQPPVFLKNLNGDDQPALVTTVPEGSQLVVRIAGEELPVLEYVTGKSTSRPEPKSTGKSTDRSQQTTEYRVVLKQSGTAQLKSAATVLGSWQFTIIADEDPQISFDEEPKRGKGRMLDLAFSLEDDYGIVNAWAEIRPVGEGDPKARPLVKPPDITLAMPRRRTKQESVKSSRDLSHHPYAGGRTAITLKATDGAKQQGKSATKIAVLPGRLFTKPLAAALVEQRRILATDARSAGKVAEMIDIIANTAPEYLINDASVFLGLQVVMRSINGARNDDQLRQVLDLLWEMALAIEDGDMSASAARLREAQEALKRALEDGASDEEIDRLMKELRQAMNQYLNELTKQMARQQQNQNLQHNPNAQTLRRRDIDRMMKRIEDLAKSGSKDAARQLLSELQQMMDQLQAGRHQQQRQREGDRFNQQMNELAEMMQKQQELMNNNFRLQQQRPGDDDQNGQDDEQDNEGGETPQGQMTPQEFADAMKRLQQQQGNLQGKLQQMMKNLEQMGVDPGRELSEAGGAMGKAKDALGKGENGEALGQQGKALEALRRGAQSLMQQMQQNMAGERGGTDQNGRRRNDRARNDPLGREQRTRGPNLGSNVKVPDEIDAQSARRIMEIIRRKLSNPGLPRIEFNYLDRLLKPQ